MFHLKSKKDTNGEETNAQRNAVEQAKDTLQKDVGLDRAVKMLVAFKDKILDDYNAFLENTFGVFVHFSNDCISNKSINEVSVSNVDVTGIKGES